MHLPSVPIARSGFVGIFGRPNVGKSTLLNQIIGEKLAIASPRPQTTRDRLLSIKHHKDSQLVLVDTPGLHDPELPGRTALNEFMIGEALRALADVDVILWVSDLRGSEKTKGPGASDLHIAEQIATHKKPLILALNKIDQIRDKNQLLPIMQGWAALPFGLSPVPISAKTGDGIEVLLDEIARHLPQGPALFPEGVLTDRAERWLCGELIREQVFLVMEEEVPYSVAVTVEAWEERIAETGHKRGQRIGALIHATIHVEKESHKKIVVGASGRMIQQIGTKARAEVGKLLDCPVHLELFVRVDPNWSQTASGLRKMGYTQEGKRVP